MSTGGNQRSITVNVQLDIARNNSRIDKPKTIQIYRHETLLATIPNKVEFVQLFLEKRRIEYSRLLQQTFPSSVSNETKEITPTNLLMDYVI